MNSAIVEGIAALVGASLLLLFVATLQLEKRTMATLWLVAVTLFPPWVALMVGGVRIPVAAVVSLAAVLNQFRSRPAWNFIDTVAVGLGACVALSVVAGGTPRHILVQVGAEWLLPYAAGRFTFDREAIPVIARRLAVALSIFALLQFVTRFDVATVFPFNIANTQAFWMGLQERGGFSRAELTFGHSIALGGTLALLLPFVAFKDERKGGGSSVWQIALVLAGVAATMSRASMLGALAVLSAAILVLRISALTRLIMVALVSGGAWAALQYFDNLARSSAGTEVNDSSSYREGLVDLMAVVEPMGLAPGGAPSTDGVTYKWLGYYSIDNSLLYVALYAGGIAAVLYVATLCLALARLTLRRSPTGNAFALALLSQVPLIVTVAPITQHQAILWFFIGLATTAGQLDKERRHDDEPSTSAQRARHAS